MDATAIRTVLLVDDEEDIRTIAELCLTEVAGWDVTPALSGFDAIEKAAARRHDVILLDMMMPGMDGVATLQELDRRGLLASSQVILLTAKVQPSEVGRYLAMGAAGVIAKPFEPMTLHERIAEILAGAP